MRISSNANGTSLDVKLSDRMAFADHGAFRGLLDQIRTSGSKAVNFDLSELVSIDSAGLGMFMIALEAAERDGWVMTIFQPQGHVRQLLQLARIDRMIKVVAA